MRYVGEDERIEGVARLLCRSLGNDNPDALVFAMGFKPQQLATGMYIAPPGQGHPLWRNYIVSATDLLAALDAGKFSKPAPRESQSPKPLTPSHDEYVECKHRLMACLSMFLPDANAVVDSLDDFIRSMIKVDRQ